MPGGTRTELILLALGIYGTYIAQGVIFESLHARDFDGRRWAYSEALLLCTLSGNLFVAGLVLVLLRPPSSPVPQRAAALFAAPMCLAAGCSYMALSRVDYPSFTLFKSAKPLAVLLVAWAAGRGALYGSRHRWAVLSATVGLMLFFGFGQARESRKELLGLACIMGSLVSDGFAALAAARISTLPEPPSQFHLQFYLSGWSLLMVGVVALYAGRLPAAFDLAFSEPAVAGYIAQISILNGVGQLFIIGMVWRFDPLVLSLVTTSRKVLTIVVSTILYGHSLAALQWAGVCVLFAGLLWQDGRDLWKHWHRKEKTEELIV